MAALDYGFCLSNPSGHLRRPDAAATTTAPRTVVQCAFASEMTCATEYLLFLGSGSGSKQAQAYTEPNWSASKRRSRLDGQRRSHGLLDRASAMQPGLLIWLCSGCSTASLHGSINKSSVLQYYHIRSLLKKRNCSDCWVCSASALCSGK
jgi:hypothetical protein